MAKYRTNNLAIWSHWVRLKGGVGGPVWQVIGALVNGLQCDQIGQFLKVLGINLLSNESKILSDFGGYIESIAFK